MRTCVLALLTFISLTFSQSFTSNPKAEAQKSFLDRDMQTLSSTQAWQQGMMSPQEHHIEPDDYFVGPGDIFNISIGNRIETTFQIPVSPEGSVLIPGVGAVFVAEKSLTETKKILEKEIKSQYINQDISITLFQLRSFRVNVSGAVVEPGLVTVNGYSRVSDAILLTGGLLDQEYLAQINSSQNTKTQQVNAMGQPLLERPKLEDTENDLKPASRRNIILKRRSGVQINVDLDKYLVAGDVEANPFLTDGDVIIVPSREKSTGEVWIQGAVRTPGKFEFAEGDDIKTLIALGHGFTTDVDSTKIELVRFNDDNKVEKLEFSFDKDRESILAFPLQADDRLFVQFIPRFHRKRNVEIKGEVMYPNVYALENGSIKLSEIIERAGGFTDRASLKNAYIIRRAHENIKDPEFERLRYMQVADMTTMERDYYKVKSREQIGSMGVDFVELFENKNDKHDVILRDRDLIIVPTLEKTVNIAGQVLNPGIIPYVEGKDLNYYIVEAGGYNWNAKKRSVRIIKGKTGEWTKPKRNVPIEIGDTIFVPEKPEIDWWELSKDFMQIGYQIATIVLVIDRVLQSN